MNGNARGNVIRCGRCHYLRNPSLLDAVPCEACGSSVPPVSVPADPPEDGWEHKDLGRKRYEKKPMVLL